MALRHSGQNDALSEGQALVAHLSFIFLTRIHDAAVLKSITKTKTEFAQTLDH